MIQEFVDRFMKRRGHIRAKLQKEHPKDYKQLVRYVVEALHDPDKYDSIDPERIHEIDDGCYQGTLVFVIGSAGYQPSEYWYVKVWYGSCSGCDTLQDINGYSSDPPTDEQVNDYMTLALHVVQGLRQMGDHMDMSTETEEEE